MAETSKVSARVITLMITENVHVRYCCNVCGKGDFVDFVFPDRNLVLNAFSCFTHFEIDWNGHLNITKRRSALMCFYLEHKYQCVRDRRLTRYFRNFLRSKNSGTKQNVHVILVSFWDTDVRRLFFWDRKVKTLFINSLGNDTRFSRIAATDNCDSVQSCSQVSLDPKLSFYEEIHHYYPFSSNLDTTFRKNSSIPQFSNCELQYFPFLDFGFVVFNFACLPFCLIYSKSSLHTTSSKQSSILLGLVSTPSVLMFLALSFHV